MLTFQRFHIDQKRKYEHITILNLLFDSSIDWTDFIEL